MTNKMTLDEVYEIVKPIEDTLVLKAKLINSIGNNGRLAKELEATVAALQDIAHNSKFSEPLPREALERIAQAALRKISH